ncbi:MAG: alpha/beta hydrolase [Desulfobacterales bacterium]|nr:MAG: alpha/beta hydrolase [Desulfobacterales bacterium]
MKQHIVGSEPSIVAANGISIAYETFGNSSDPAILLIMGLGYQMIFWDDEFCAQLSSRGHFVIRFDNRDSGLSTWLNDAGIPDIPAMKKLMAKRKKTRSPYSLLDMAGDAKGLLDAINIEFAHIVGRSMGGMIGQMMAIHHPERVKTLTSIMSSTSDPNLPPPKSDVLSIVLEPEPTDKEGFINHCVRILNALSGPECRIDESRVRKWAIDSYQRGLNPNGAARQFAAILATGSRKEALKSVRVPTLVIHGDADPLVPVECSVDLADTIFGARLLVIRGLGHTLVPQVYPQIIDAISLHAAKNSE